MTGKDYDGRNYDGQVSGQVYFNVYLHNHDRHLSVLKQIFYVVPLRNLLIFILSSFNIPLPVHKVSIKTSI